jgi:hypothetical protein
MEEDPLGHLDSVLLVKLGVFDVVDDVEKGSFGVLVSSDIFEVDLILIQIVFVFS